MQLLWDGRCFHEAAPSFAVVPDAEEVGGATVLLSAVITAKVDICVVAVVVVARCGD